MIICRFTHDGETRLGVVDEAGEIADLGDSEVATEVRLALEADGGFERIADAAPSAPRLPLIGVTLEAPIARPPKFLAIGLNYADHIAETNRDAPDFPIFFNKQSTCVVGPGAPIHIPRASDMVDYEGELGVVIGRRCRHVSADDAHRVVAGYLVVNDVSVRDWQVRTPTMTLGKSFDTHGPIGPWIVTADEIGDPHGLAIKTWVGDELLQDGNTKAMIFDIWHQIETLSTVCTLEPGDIIATGTPAGVGVARTPPRFLRDGDVVRVEIERVGVLENPVVAEPDDTRTNLGVSPRSPS